MPSVDMKKAARSFFRSELARHGDALNPMAQQDQDRLLVKDLLPGTGLDIVLDVSCGTGFMARICSELGAAMVVAADLCEDVVVEGKRRQISGLRIEWLVCDGEHLPFVTGCFSLATCRYSFHHFPKPEAALEEIRRVLRGNGSFLLVDPTPPVGEPVVILNQIFSKIERDLAGHNRFYTQDELVEMAERTGFSVESRLESLLLTELSLPGFLEEFAATPERLKKRFGVKLDERTGKVAIKLPVTFLMLKSSSQTSAK